MAYTLPYFTEFCDPVTRYFIGWIWIGLIAINTLVNVFFAAKQFITDACAKI